VVVSHGIGEAHVHELHYDCLVLALGSITNFFNLPGLAERALTMKSLGDAIVLRNRMIEHLEEADFECAADHRPHLLTFVVAGGGFAGVETIAGMNDFLRDALRFYPHLTQEMIRCVLVHPGEVILPELGESLGRYAQKKLIEDGIEILVNTKVAGVSEREVTLSDGQTIESKTLLWTAGTSPNPILRTLPCNKDRGRVVVNEFMEVEGAPGVWALGDCAVVPDRKSGEPYPPTAQHALRQGRVLAKNVAASLRGGRQRPFTFTTLGQLASIGKRKGVAKMFGFHFAGFIAWWLWRSIYLSKLPRFEKKVRVALDWTLDILFTKDLVQFMTLRSPTVSHREEEAPARATAAAPK
jgi:NADH dehydrogenase